MKRTTVDQEGAPSFDVSVENELLMLKLKAEFGAECITGSEDIPPSVVNEFLKSVYQFEQKFRQRRSQITIYDKIGRPHFKKSNELNDKQIAFELKRLLKQMHEHQLELDVVGEYADREIYTFLTEEFFGHQMEDLAIAGYIHHFCYEEFHPNHELDIRNRAVEFLRQWFDRKMDEYSWQLSDVFIHPDSREFAKQEIVRKVNNIFAAYMAFRNCSYRFNEVSFEWHDDERRRRGYAGGIVKYDAVKENGQITHIEGPFQFYLANTDSWWAIFYFIFPGFSWTS